MGSPHESRGIADEVNDFLRNPENHREFTIALNVGTGQVIAEALVQIHDNYISIDEVNEEMYGEIGIGDEDRVITTLMKRFNKSLPDNANPDGIFDVDLSLDDVNVINADVIRGLRFYQIVIENPSRLSTMTTDILAQKLQTRIAALDTLNQQFSKTTGLFPDEAHTTFLNSAKAEGVGK